MTTCYWNGRCGRNSGPRIGGPRRSLRSVTFCRHSNFAKECSWYRAFGQMHGLVIRSSDRVIRRSLIWCDQRSQAQVDGINRLLERIPFRLHRESRPHRLHFPETSLVRENEPPHFERLRKLLLPKDYVRFCLTGEYATDVSDASERHSSMSTSPMVERNDRSPWPPTEHPAGGARIDSHQWPYFSRRCRSHRAWPKTPPSLEARVTGGKRGRKRNRGVWGGFMHARNVGSGIRPYGFSRIRFSRTCTHILSCR